MRCVFTLSTARSGTRFLAELAKRNLRHAACRHEPYFDRDNPVLFGPAISARTRGDLEFLRARLRRKRRYVESLRAQVYVETSHAFLKSYYDLAPEYFPDLKVIHLVRDPLKCALSESTRTLLLDRVHFPGRRYRDADGRSCLRWSLTGYEPIYRSLGSLELTRFQFHLVEWIELQNRAIDFLDRFDKHADCVTLDSPHELNDPVGMAAALRSLGLEQLTPEVVVAGRQNRTPWFPTVVTTRERSEATQVLRALPDKYFEVFHRPLFTRFAWTPDLMNRYESTDPTYHASIADNSVGHAIRH